MLSSRGVFVEGLFSRLCFFIFISFFFFLILSHFGMKLYIPVGVE